MLGTDDQELRRYTQDVEAVKIKQLIMVDGYGDATIVPDEDGVWSFQVSYEYVITNLPETGGYYLKYPDGSEGFSTEFFFDNNFEEQL